MTEASTLTKIQQLIHENLRRDLWRGVLSFVVMLFYFPVGSFMTSELYLGDTSGLDAAGLTLQRQLLLRDFEQQHSGGSILVILFLMALVMAFSAFAYLHDIKKTGPDRPPSTGRSLRYVLNIISSLADTLIPYLVMCMASAAIIAVRTGSAWCMAYAFRYFLINTGFFLLLYMTAVLAVMLTGNLLSAELLAALLYFWGIYIPGLFDALMLHYFSAYLSRYNEVSSISGLLSPFGWVFMPSGRSDGFRAAISYAVGVLLILCCLIIYRLRQPGKASVALAFRWTGVPVKLMVCIPSALTCMLIFGSMMENDPVWTAFSLICAVLLTSAALEILYHMDFSMFFAGKRSLAACMGISLFLFAFFRYDITGYDSYLPERSHVASAGVYTALLEDIYGSEDTISVTDLYGSPYLSYSYYTDRDAVDRMAVTGALDAVYEAAAGGISDSSDASRLYDESDNVWDLLVAWHLRGGRTVYRHYYTDTGRITGALYEIYESAEFKQAIYPLLNKDDDEISCLTGIGWQDALGIHSLDFADCSAEEKASRIKKLYETYVSELMGLDAETRTRELPVATIQFRSSYFEEIYSMLDEADSFSKSELLNLGHYPVYPSFAGTLKLMGEYGAGINQGLVPDNIDCAVICDYRDYTTDESGALIYPMPELYVTDEEMIREILESAYSYLLCGNSLCPRNYDLEVQVKLKSEYMDIVFADNPDMMERTIYMGFTGADIPEFVREYFDIK